MTKHCTSYSRNFSAFAEILTYQIERPVFDVSDDRAGISMGLYRIVVPGAATQKTNLENRRPDVHVVGEIDACPSGGFGRLL
jgi:hypothetical protein